MNAICFRSCNACSCAQLPAPSCGVKVPLASPDGSARPRRFRVRLRACRASEGVQGPAGRLRLPGPSSSGASTRPPSPQLVAQVPRKGFLLLSHADHLVSETAAAAWSRSTARPCSPVNPFIFCRSLWPRGRKTNPGAHTVLGYYV